MASQTHTGPYQLWDKLPCRAPASGTEAAWLCVFGSSVAVFACLAGSRALPHTPASTCLFPCAPHFFRPSFLSTAPSLHAPWQFFLTNFIPAATPTRLSLLSSPQTCHSPPGTWGISKTKRPRDRGWQQDLWREGAPPKQSPVCRGRGPASHPLGPRPLSPAWTRPRAAQALPGRGFLRRRGRWPSAPLWRVAPATLGPARRAQPRLFQARWTSWCCWVPRPS